MYIDRLNQYKLGNKPMNPAKLLKMSDQDLQNQIGFSPVHVQWLRQEAAVIPWALLKPSNYISNHLCNLSRGSNLRSVSQNRKNHQHYHNHSNNYHQPGGNLNTLPHHCPHAQSNNETTNKINDIKENINKQNITDNLENLKDKV